MSIGAGVPLDGVEMRGAARDSDALAVGEVAVAIVRPCLRRRGERDAGQQRQGRGAENQTFHVRIPSPDHPNSGPAFGSPASRAGIRKNAAERAFRLLLYRKIAMR
jgi:hypothetical protein